jgi:DNA-binding CsgD family transcriptional regulator
MSKADTLRLRDVRNAYRLIGECRDLGSDPTVWRRHMLAGVQRLFGATQVAGGEGQLCRPTGPIRALSAFDVTDDPVVHAGFVAYQRAGGPADDPYWRAFVRVPGRLVTLARRQLVPDADWFRSHSYQAFRKPGRIMHELSSVMATSADGRMSVISLNRVIGEADFSAREQRLFDFFHSELGRLIGSALASVTEPAPDSLSPRLRQTLRCLLEGDSENQIAARLGLSQATVHQYVMMLYERFGVRSRGQLLAHVLRRARHQRWRGFLS